MDATRDERRQVAVIGAGITGLVTAFWLERARPDWRVAVFEAAPRPGGKVRTTERDGYTVDRGPHGFLSGEPATLALIRDLGLETELQPAADAARRRYLYRDGGLRPLPASPPAFLTSEIVPWPGRLRAALEVVLPTRSDDEESVYAFLARHFGRAFADGLADALVSGITAGDPRELSIDALFPRLRAMEHEHGSLLRALLARQRAARGHLTSFRGGMQRLVDALHDAITGEVRLGRPVAALEPLPAGAAGIALRCADAEPERFDAVVVTTPAGVTSRLLRPLVPSAAEALAAVPYAGVRAVGLGFARSDVPRALDGSGFLVPRGQGVRSLGVLWTSSLYPGRAPGGQVLLRVLAGGRLDKGMLELSEDDALDAVRRDLRLTMGIVAEPTFVETALWPEGIPQYTLGHRARVEAAERALAALPAVHLAGNAYRGVGVNDCVREAQRAVTRVVAQLAGDGAA